MPIAKGGAYIVGNVVPLCHARPGVPCGNPACNQSKNDKDPEAWLLERFGARKAKAILKRINAYFAWVREQDGD